MTAARPFAACTVENLSVPHDASVVESLILAEDRYCLSHPSKSTRDEGSKRL